jgi:hypothetical protein
MREADGRVGRLEVGLDDVRDEAASITLASEVEWTRGEAREDGDEVLEEADLYAKDG